MKSFVKPLSAIAAATLTIALLPAAAQSQAYPVRPVRIVVPAPAGGASDTVARMLAQALSTSLGQQFIVENKAGASGAIAAQAVMTAPADGYTLLWAQSSMAALPMLQKNSPYKHMNELTPVANILNFGYAVYVNNDLPVKDFASLVAHGKANPDKLSYATGTLGEYMASTHVFKAAGVKAVRIPYKGGAQLMADLINGQVQVNFGPIVSGAQQAKAGKIRILATLLPQRLGSLPEVPTLAELGVPAGNIPTWNAVFAPPNTPREVVNRLSMEIAQAMTSAALRATLEQQGSQPLGSTPQQLADDVEASTVAWRNFIREYDIPQEQ